MKKKKEEEDEDKVNTSGARIRKPKPSKPIGCSFISAAMPGARGSPALAGSLALEPPAGKKSKTSRAPLRLLGLKISARAERV